MTTPLVTISDVVEAAAAKPGPVTVSITVTGQDASWLVNQFIQPILSQLQKMEDKLMAQIDDLSAQMDQLDADEKALIVQDQKSFADLEAAIKAGTTGPNLQPFIDRLKTSHTALAQALIDSAAADATLNPPPPTP